MFTKAPHIHTEELFLTKQKKHIVGVDGSFVIIVVAVVDENTNKRKLPGRQSIQQQRATLGDGGYYN